MGKLTWQTRKIAASGRFMAWCQEHPAVIGVGSNEANARARAEAELKFAFDTAAQAVNAGQPRTDPVRG